MTHQCTSSNTASSATPHQQQQRTSSNSASAHQNISSIRSISTSAASALSAHQQHQCISSNSPSAASAHSQQQHFSSNSASAVGGSKKTKVKKLEGALSNPIPLVLRSSEHFLFLRLHVWKALPSSPGSYNLTIQSMIEFHLKMIQFNF